MYNMAALSARRGNRETARERLRRAGEIREVVMGGRSVELAEVNAALALWSVVVVVGKDDKTASSLCLSKREARAHARAALAVFEELAAAAAAAAAEGEKEASNNSDAVVARARHAAERVAQLKRFLRES